MAHETKIRQIAVLAYGSLLAHPGEWFGSHMKKVVRCRTPFGVEYLGQANEGRGGAPTLVRTERGCRARGGLIVLPFTETPRQLSNVIERLCDRERAASRSSIKHDLRMLGYRVVYSDFEARFDNPAPEVLAKAALESVERCFRDGHAFMNGIRYLSENIEWGVVTMLTDAYRRAILELAGTGTLEEAEQNLLEAAQSRSR